MYTGKPNKFSDNRLDTDNLNQMFNTRKLYQNTATEYKVVTGILLKNT